MKEQSTNVNPSYNTSLEAIADTFVDGVVDKEVSRHAVKVPLGGLDDVIASIILHAETRSNHGISLTPEQLGAYVSLLQFARVGFVQTTLGLSAIRKVKLFHPKHVIYPAVLFPLLQGLGRVEDIDLAIEWFPDVDWGIAEIEAKYNVTLDDRFVQFVSDWLHRLEAMGLQLATSLPKGPEGSFGYVMAIKASTVVSPSRKAMPIDAITAALLQNTVLDSAIRYPFSYGSLTVFTSLPSAIASRGFMSRGGA